MNYLYLGDCHNVLKNEIADESVDLIYIDPPFNSKRDYNIFFDSKEIQTQRIAFEDTWTLTNIQDSLAELNTLQTHKLYTLLTTYQDVAPHAFPYLVMMGLRILELHRVLKTTGSFYLHCDPTMSHYLKTVCDLIFGPKNFINEIIWKRTSAGKPIYRNLPKNNDTIFWYVKTDKYVYIPLREDLSKEDKATFNLDDGDGRGAYNTQPIINPGDRPNLKYIYKDMHGRKWNPPSRGWRFNEERMRELEKDNRLYFTKNTIREKYYLSERSLKGKQLSNIWTDIGIATINESLGYPTQKPKALLERIIKASSNEGDIVLDAFCGCGTSIDAAEGLHRKWIGIDISPIAISLIKRRLKDSYKDSLSKFEVRGVPEDEPSAIRLWNENPFAFQDWWLTEFEVFSTTEGTKGADKGIDGIGQYLIGEDSFIRIAFQVKGGKVQSKDIDALIGVLSKHKCELGIFLTIEPPTKPMLDTAAQQGFVEFPGFQFPRIQIHTLKDFFANKRPKLPATNITFKAAQFKGKKSKQIDLGL